MTYTYTWANEDQTGLIREDQAGDKAFVPALTENRAYGEYLDWVTQGNTASAFVDPDYDTIANARTTRITTARRELKTWLRRNADFDFAILRMVANSTFTIDAGTESTWDAAYTLLTNFEAAINLEADIEDVRLSTIDFDADSYNIPA